MVTQTVVDFMLGFVAGEGCFSASVHPEESRRLNVVPQVGFSVGVNESKIIDTLNNEFDFGDTAKSGDKYTWYVKDHHGREKLIDLIESQENHPFTETKKYQQFKRWKVCHNIYGGETTGKEQMKEFIDCCTKVNPDTGNTSEYSRKELKKLVDSGRTERIICGEETDQTDKPCQMPVKHEDEICHRHE